MLIFKNENNYYIYIHIPKNAGKYIRTKIIKNKNNQIIKKYWNIVDNLDLAHIPYIKKNLFIDINLNYNYFTYTRCPYDRIISGFFYKNSEKKIEDFKDFIKNTLPLYKFDIIFDQNIIHYYPQYLFVCDENSEICKNIDIKKLEDNEKPRKYNLTKYFDDECINIINNIYHNDFIFFNYEKINNMNYIE